MLPYQATICPKPVETADGATRESCTSSTVMKAKVCAVLPCPPVYSETFLRAHVEQLPATANYVGQFPVDTDREYPLEQACRNADRLRLKSKASLHRYILNPAKRVCLRSFFKRNDIDIVLGEYGPAGCAALEICHELKLPLVTHFHGYDAYSRRVLGEYHEAYRRMFRYCSAVIAVSSHMVEQLVRLGASREKIVLNPYGVDTAAFRPTHLRACPLQVVAVGRMVEKKAPYLTILAFRKVLEKLPEARLVMVGDGNLLDICRKMIKSLGIDHAVELKGALGHRDVAELMRQSRIFVQHSVTPESGDSEGTPVGIIEAGASGLPVVSTKHAGIVDIVLHGKTGFLVDEGDIDGMADYICRLLLDQDMAEEMGRQAREHVSRNYELSSSIQNLRAVLDYHAR